jgi:hypothetical protein
MLANFKHFIDNVIMENLHPELQSLIQSKTTNKSKQTALVKKIKDLTSRGEKTGIEGNMPKGSSRAYMQHAEPEHIKIDDTPTTMKVGTKVAIRAFLDKYHKKHEYGDLPLGAMQNHAENGDHWVNNNYRTLTHTGDDNFKTNTESGVFPPLVDHDEHNHEWTKVGHARDVKAGDWKKLTKHKDFPDGITHKQLFQTLMRAHNKRNGKYWDQSKDKEAELDRIERHPLIQKFDDYHGNTGHSPADYQQIKNLGIWKHPVNGSEHIVARDHGYNSDVEGAYKDANRRYIMGFRR